MCVCAICRKVGEGLGLVVQYGELKQGGHTGRWLSGVERGGHGKCCQMVTREVKRIRGRGGGVKIGASPVI